MHRSNVLMSKVRINPRPHSQQGRRPWLTSRLIAALLVRSLVSWAQSDNPAVPQDFRRRFRWAAPCAVTFQQGAPTSLPTPSSNELLDLYRFPASSECRPPSLFMTPDSAKLIAPGQSTAFSVRITNQGVYYFRMNGSAAGASPILRFTVGTPGGMPGTLTPGGVIGQGGGTNATTNQPVD